MFDKSVPTRGRRGLLTDDWNVHRRKDWWRQTPLTEWRDPGPDEFWSAEPIVGYRTWGWNGSYLVGARQPWYVGEYEAGCVSGHEAPHWTCQCGIYAQREVQPDLGWLRSFDVWVLGKVELTGLVIEHRLGYRAQRAKIVQLYVHNADLVPKLEEFYCPRVRVVSFKDEEGTDEWDW